MYIIKILPILGLMLLCGCAGPGGDVENSLWPGENRTANLSPTARVFYPDWVMQTPEHYEFLPLVSNYDVQNQHSAQWEGQDWDPSMWNRDWTPEIAVRHFYAAHIFKEQYMENRGPVLEVGPMFYRLSDLDRRRTLKLLADYSGVFNNGYTVVILRDWETRRIVGSYTEKGMYLN
jgi:hypothetical protein